MRRSIKDTQARELDGQNTVSMPESSRLAAEGKPSSHTRTDGHSYFYRKTEQILEWADIQINGNRPWDIQVKNQKLFSQIWAQGTLGLGEAYMNGWWDCEQLDEFFYRAESAHLEKYIRTWHSYAASLLAKLCNLQTYGRSLRVGRQHYDISNDFYQQMLDPLMIYSCGYWEHANTLQEAQSAKLDLIARKLKLSPGMRVLDIGCGWGGAAKYMADHHGVEVVGITISHEQATFARKHCQGLPIEIRFQDYREIDEQFDRIYSIGMLEHVGSKNYKKYAEVVKRCLADDGLSLIHTITNSKTRATCDRWIAKYIFPNSVLPSAVQICASLEDDFIIEDIHNIGNHYDRTLMSWWENFEKAWPGLKVRFDEKFHRMWRYYLLSCAGSFRARNMQLWQIIMSPQGVRGGYKRVS